MNEKLIEAVAHVSDAEIDDLFSRVFAHCVIKYDPAAGKRVLRAAIEAAKGGGEAVADLVSRAEVIRTLRALGDQDADLALYGAADNARSREYGEAAATRACCAVALIPAASPTAPALPQDVVRLVIAARDVAYSDPTPETMQELDKASEAFAERVPWEDEPDHEEDGPSAPAAVSCEYCDGTGDVHSLDGEWRGTCDCQHATPTAPEPVQTSGTEAGGDLASALRLMRDLKRTMEHERRFGSTMPNNPQRVLTRAEGDIEEWLIDHGYQHSYEREALAKPASKTAPAATELAFEVLALRAALQELHDRAHDFGTFAIDDADGDPLTAWENSVVPALVAARATLSAPAAGEVKPVAAISADYPDRIWAERDEDTNEKRWFSIKGMGVEYVRSASSPSALNVAVEALERAKRWMPASGSDEQIDADLRFVDAALATIRATTEEKG